jgi:hypothetical protein
MAARMTLASPLAATAGMNQLSAELPAGRIV